MILTGRDRRPVGVGNGVNRGLSRAGTAGILLLILLPSIYLAWRFSRLGHLGALGDDGIYLVTAKALASGDGYRISSLPEQPWQTKYPILFPLALAAAWRLAPQFPGNLPVIMGVCWLFLPLLLLMSLRLAGDFGLPARQRWLVAAMLALNPMVLLLSVSPMSEIMCSFLLTGSLVLVNRASARESGPCTALAAGLVGGAAFLTRTAALPLVVTAPIFFLWRKQPRKAAAFLCGMLPAIAEWSWWSHSHVVQATDLSRAFYTDYLHVYRLNAALADLPVIILNNVAHLFQAMGGTLLMMQDDSTWLRLAGIAVPIGLYLLFEKQGLTHGHLFTVAYCLLLLILPYTPNERLLVPVMPVLLAGIVALSSRPMVHAAMAGGLAILCLLGVSGPRPVNEHLSALERTGRDLSESYVWINSNLPKQARFISAYDCVVYLYTGHRGTTYRVPTGLTYRDNRAGLRWAFEQLPQFARANGLDYILTTSNASVAFLGESETEIAGDVVRQHFDLAYRNGGVSIFRRRNGAYAATSANPR